MNDKELLAQAIEVCRLLFLRNKTSGSSANMSFLNEAGELYVTASGTCFGTLVPEDFSKLSPDGELRMVRERIDADRFNGDEKEGRGI